MHFCNFVRRAGLAKPGAIGFAFAMARLFLFVLPLMLAGTAVHARETLGIYENWGAFRDEGPSCFAIAQPTTEDGQAPVAATSAAIGYWSTRGSGAQFHAKLSRPSRSGTALVSLDSKRFVLRGKGRDMWMADRRDDRAIIAAIRGARAMSIAATAPGGAPFADVYDLRGAATAIDAAALGCIRQNVTGK